MATACGLLFPGVKCRYIRPWLEQVHDQGSTIVRQHMNAGGAGQPTAFASTTEGATQQLK
jgi:hypothetical protein